MLQSAIPFYSVRRSRDWAFCAIIIFATIGITMTNALWFSNEQSFVWEWQRASGGWINANLTLFLPLSLGVMLIALTGGGLCWEDIGFRKGFLTQLALTLAVGWVAIQLIALVISLVYGKGFALSPAWERNGIGAMLGFLIAMIIGTALFEDMVFRAILFPQLYLRLERFGADHVQTASAALVISAIIFALWHLPTIILNREVAPLASLAALAYMLLGGVMLGLVFIRTGRLALAMSCHVLVNAPTMVVDSPASGSLLAGVFGIGVILAGPLLVGQPWSVGVIRPVLRASEVVDDRHPA